MKRRGIILMCLLLVLCLAGLCLTPALAEEEQDTLKVGFVQDRAPVSFADGSGQLRGVSRYIFDRLSSLTGLKFEYVPLPAGSVTYDYLLSQGFDLVTSVERNRENEEARGILISDPYFVSRKVIVARPGLAFSRDDNLSMAVSSGSQTLRKVLRETFPNYTLVDYDTITDCFDAVRSGRADLLIQNQYVVEYWSAKPAYEDLKIIPVLGMEEELCFSAVVTLDGVTGPSEEAGRALIEKLNQGISRLSEDEVDGYTITSVMENQYEYTLSDILYRYRVPAVILAVAAVIILGLGILAERQHIRSIKSAADARAKDSFLSAMSHEIRTPLNGMIGLNYLMGQRLDDPNRVESYLRQSTSAAKYLLGLVDDLLDMSHLSQGAPELTVGSVDLELLIQTARSIVSADMSGKSLHFEVRSVLPHRYVTGDAVRIQQILMNLLDNARKFTPEGGSVTLRADQSVEGERIITRLAVTDTGPGMSQEFQKHAFDPFAQERNTVSQGNQGAGLGLPISRRLARAMGGDLTFESRPEEGSTFIFTFPGEAAQPEDAPPAAPGFPAGGRVLVAEDNQLNREIMVELLTGEGFEVETAEDGKQALESFSRSPAGSIGVILMDILMPEMDGREAARAIRALDRPDAKTVRIIACTANASDRDRQLALGSGMDDFIPKPVDIATLLQKLSPS